MSDSALFLITLDVELGWGLARSRSNHLDLLKKDEKQVREAIDFLLKNFEGYQIPATWAMVGHLFLDSCQKKDGIPHPDMPHVRDDWYSCDPATNITQDPLFYGRDIVEKVLASRLKHEIGYHSFSHVIFSECSRQVAQAEIEAGLKLARESGIELKSFVFPKNQIGHIDVLKEYGFQIYRGKNLTRAVQNSYLMNKLGAIMDTGLAPPTEARLVEGIWELPSSLYFCEPRLPFTLLPRTKLGLRRAINSKKIFHVFLHPWNLVIYPQIRDDLVKLLRFVAQKQAQGKLEVTTMAGLASRLNQGRETKQ